MIDNIDSLYWLEFSICWSTFEIDDAWNVTTAECWNIGHIEECLENGFSIHQLFEAKVHISI